MSKHIITFLHRSAAGEITWKRNDISKNSFSTNQVFLNLEPSLSEILRGSILFLKTLKKNLLLKPGPLLRNFKRGPIFKIAIA